MLLPQSSTHKIPKFPSFTARGRAYTTIFQSSITKSQTAIGSWQFAIGTKAQRHKGTEDTAKSSGQWSVASGQFSHHSSLTTHHSALSLQPSAFSTWQSPNNKLFFCLFAFLSFCLKYFLFSVPTYCLDAHYLFTSDYIIFSIDDKVVSCTGRINFSFKALTITSDSMQIDVNKNILLAQGNVIIRNDKNLAGILSSSLQTSGQTTYQATDTLKQTSKIFEGDSLIFDLEFIGGVIYKTGKEMGKIYLRGEELSEMAFLPEIKTNIQITSEPSLSVTNVTSTKMKISPEGKYEGWNASIWIKGNKIISLPYYTNTGKGITPGVWRLTKVRYNNDGAWFMSSEVRYKEASSKRGFFYVDYTTHNSQKSDYGLRLVQNFQIGSKYAASLNISNLLSADYAYSLSLIKRSFGYRSQTFNYNNTKNGSESLNFNMSSNRKNLDTFLSVNANRNNYSLDKVLQSNMNIFSRSKYIGSRRYLGMTYNSSLSFINQPEETYSGTFNLNLFRSSWKVGARSYLDPTLSLHKGANTEGKSDSGNTWSLGYRLNFNQLNLFTLNFNRSENRTSGGIGSSRNQTVDSSLSFGHITKWNARLSTSYDVENSVFSSLVSLIDFRFNKRFRIYTNSTYDLERDIFMQANFNIIYNLLGMNIYGNWFTKTNDFSLEFLSPFK